MAEDINNSLFSNEVLDAVEASSIRSKEKTGPVTVLGRTFANDDERRAYFREELRKKLPELKKIEGFPIGKEQDIIMLSDPPYYTACPNPWLKDFVTEWEDKKKTLKRDESKVVTEPYASDVSEGKYDPLYLYHSYLTKVPHKAIINYLEHFTQPGDIVIDGFAGTGMTGAACRLSTSGERNAVCVDLSPLATFISYCVNSNMSPLEFEKKAKEIVDKAEEECSWMYQTAHKGGKGTINYVLWSEAFSCPECGHEIVFWDDCVDIEHGKINDSYPCPHCGTALTKKSLQKRFETTFDKTTNTVVKRVKHVPVLINYTFEGHRFEKKPDAEDIELINKIENLSIPYWVPTDLVPEGDKTVEAIQKGITTYNQFYFKRTLYVFGKLKDQIDLPILNFIITKLAFQSTLMYRYTYMSGTWGAGGGPMSGTLYIPSLIKELNVFKQLKDVITSRRKIELGSQEDGHVAISTQSATSICQMPDNSVDYIFTDPPFGSNLMYSELNSISEVWLKVKTNSTEECIVNSTQRKTLFDYQNLMQGAFSQYFRVLKPGKWISIEFSNTSAAVWNSIQVAIQQAGFVVANVSALDKQKGTYNATNSTTAVKQDLVITCFKPSVDFDNRFEIKKTTVDSVWDFIEEYLGHLPIHVGKDNVTTTVVERTPKVLYDRLISFFVQKGLQVPINAADFQIGLRNRFEEHDGMFFTAVQLNEYIEKKKYAPEFVPMGLIVSNEADGIEWLRNRLRDNPQTYQDIQPDWMQAINGLRKGDILPELRELLEENFIEEADGTWRLPNIQDDVDKDKLREKALLKEFKIYVEAASKPHARIKEVRVEAIRAGFKKCYMDKDFATIVMVGDKIPQNLLTEDDILLQFYDIARTRV